MNLYVSNLAYSVTDDELREAFGVYGSVTSARVIMDRDSGRSRGFGFVEMADDGEANAAITALNDQGLGGRPLKVVEARPKDPRPGGFGGGGGGGGGGYKGGGGGGGGYKGGGGGGGGYKGGGGGGGGYKGGGGGWKGGDGGNRKRGGDDAW